MWCVLWYFVTQEGKEWAVGRKPFSIRIPWLKWDRNEAGSILLRPHTRLGYPSPQSVLGCATLRVYLLNPHIF